MLYNKDTSKSDNWISIKTQMSVYSKYLTFL